MVAQDSLDIVKKSLDNLPPPPSENPVVELLRMVSTIHADVQKLYFGSEGHERLLQQCRPLYQQLKYDVLSTAPNFRPFKTAREDNPGFTIKVDQEDTSHGRVNKGTTQPTYLQDVRSQIQRWVGRRPNAMFICSLIFTGRSLTRQLPFNVPFAVKVNLIEQFFGNWETYCLDCFNAIHKVTQQELRDLAQRRFGGSAGTVLLAEVHMICDELVEKHRLKALELIKFQLQLENPPFTMNDHYFSACRVKYLSQYKSAKKVS